MFVAQNVTWVLDANRPIWLNIGLQSMYCKQSIHATININKIIIIGFSTLQSIHYKERALYQNRP